MASDLDVFATIPFSYLTGHPDMCCVSAKSRLLSELDSGPVEEALAAIPEVVKWEALRWPAHWCELDSGEDGWIGDCGVHAALASSILYKRGFAASRAQIAIRGHRGHLEHWRARWARADVPATWVGESSVYHEVVWVGSRFWDPTEARWFDGVDSDLLAGRVVAVRLEGGAWVEEM